MIAKDEAVPVYMVFTNEQLAQMVRRRPSKADLDKIAGVGEARIQKYGDAFWRARSSTGMGPMKRQGG